MLDETLEPLGLELITEFQAHATHAEERITAISDEIQQNIYTIMTFQIVISVMVIILGVIVAMITAKKITNPIEPLMGRMKAIASGNLDNHPLTVNTQDEIGQLMTASNDMNKNMRTMMLKITDVTQRLSAHSEELTESTHEVRQGTEQISNTMEELATGSETQANQASALSNVMSKFTGKMEEVNRNTIYMQEESNQVLEMTNEGSIFMDSSTNQMENIDAIVRDVVKKVEDLDEKTQDISKLVTVSKKLPIRRTYWP